MKKSLWICLFALLVVACSGGDGSGEDPVVSKDYLNVTPDEVRLSADGESKTITISANCRWTITKSINSDWLEVSDPSGSNDGIITVKAGKNSTGYSRSAILTIVGTNVPARRVTITQDKGSEGNPSEEDFINVISSLTLSGDGETKEITISSNCNWTITSSDAWLTVTPSSGNGEGVVTVSAGKNSTGSERTATLTVQGGNAPTKTVMVTQAKGTDDTPVDDTQEPGKDDNLPPE